jgi:hypothetical protein
MNPSALLLRAASVAVLVAAFLSLSLPTKKQRADYFPLAPGLTWEYEVTDARGGGALMRVVNEGERVIGGYRATVQRMEAGPSVGYRFAVAERDRVALVGEQGPGEAEPRTLDPPGILLRLPPVKGATWESEVMTTAIAPGTVVKTATAVESVDDKVIVPAGTFESCVRLVSNGRAEARLPGQDEAVEVIVGTRLWYAPGVGLVKIFRRETSNRPGVGSAQFTFQLMARP